MSQAMSGNQYAQAMVNQTPRYDNQVRKGKRKKKKDERTRTSPKGGYR